MKSFNSEYGELIKWYKSQLDEAKIIPFVLNGRDGSTRSIAERNIDIEYRKKLSELETKYNIEESDKPVTKARTFNDIIKK